MLSLKDRVRQLIEQEAGSGVVVGDPIEIFEQWLGLSSNNNVLLLDRTIEDSFPSKAFFSKFNAIIQWSLNLPFAPLHKLQDFERLEALYAIKWLRHCMDLSVSPSQSFAELAVDESLLLALHHHTSQLVQLQSVSTIYVQSLRRNVAARLDKLQEIQAINEKLEMQFDHHLHRLEFILGQSYLCSNMKLRSLMRQQLAVLWHMFVVSNNGPGGIALQENNRAAGIAMTLRLALRILKGITSTPLAPAYRHLLKHSLLPLHQPDSLILWRDQTSLLDLYHEPLVQCIAVLCQKEPALLSSSLAALVTSGVWTTSNTPKLILLLHEMDTLLKLVTPELDGMVLEGCWSAIYTKLCSAMGADNSRLSERSLQFFRNPVFKRLFDQDYETALPMLLKAVVNTTELPWNPTVRKMIYNVLHELHENDKNRFEQACQSVAKSTRDIMVVPCKKKGAPPPSPETPAARMLPKPANKRASKPPDFTMKTSSRPPKRTTPPMNNRRMDPPLPRNVIGRGKAPWSSTNPPPLTITGVAPWARQQQSTSPQASTVVNDAGKLKSDSIIEEDNGDVLTSSSSSNACLDRVLKYMEMIKPPPEESGASHWSQEQMAESPTLLPDLKFHDLVFGHELGSGAFGVVRYARRIDQKTTRSKWAEYGVKVITTSKIKEMGYEASVQREIAILGVMVHPGIARLISSFQFRDGAYLVLEYASKGDVHTLLRSHGSLDHDSTVFVVGEAVAALASIHEMGFVYGDLKLENMVITESGHIKLTDFGACRPYSDEAKVMIEKRSKNLLRKLRDGDWKPKANEEQAEDDVHVSDWSGATHGAEENSMREGEMIDDRVEGTAAFLPPEVVLGAVPGPSSDIWALGCVVYQCLSGRPPLLEDDDEATKRKIVSFNVESIQDDILFSQDCSKDIGNTAKILIRRLLSRDYTRRPDIRQVANDPFFGGRDVFASYRLAAPSLDVGSVAPVTDAKWARRQLSSIWAPQPKAYDISVDQSDDKRESFSSDDLSATIPEGDEANAFFSFAKQNSFLHEVKETQGT